MTPTALGEVVYAMWKADDRGTELHVDLADFSPYAQQTLVAYCFDTLGGRVLFQSQPEAGAPRLILGTTKK